MTATDSTEPLLGRVRQTRHQVEAFIASAAPRKRRLLNLTIVGGTLAAALTAAPAVGGQSFTAWLTMALGLDGPSWRLLCGAASLSSITATVATQLLKSNHLEEYLGRALGCRARLEALDVGLALGHLELRHATTEYLKCVEDAAVFGGG